MTPEGARSCPRCGETLSLSDRTERLALVDLDGLDGLGGLDGPEGLNGEMLPDPDAPGSLLASAPLIGQAPLLHRLVTLATEAARKSDARFCLVTAPPGAGKTRLLIELAEALTLRASPTLRVFHSTAAAGGPPHAPLAALLRQRFEIPAHVHGPEAEQAAREQLLRGCRALLPAVRATEVAHLLAEVLRLPFPESPVSERDPGGKDRQARISLACKRLIEADAGRGPIALLFDEMEHASPEMVNLLHFLAAGLSGRPVFLCAFARPEIAETHPNFGQGEAACERLSIPPLAPADAVVLLRTLVSVAGEVPAQVVRHVKKHAEEHLGVLPRVVIELLRYLQEAGALHLAPYSLDEVQDGPDHKEAPAPGTDGDAGLPRWDLARLSRLALPQTLEDILAARLTVMDPAERELLELAAPCGERFWADAVLATMRASEVGLGLPPGLSPGAAGAGDPDGPPLEVIVVAGDRASTQVGATLRRLMLRGLVSRLDHSTIEGEREYRFAPPPLRDVIYEATPLVRRRRVHALLAQWLALSPTSEREETQEAIGRHLERAGLGDAAAARYLRAGELARDRYAHARATRLFARAVACLGTSDLAARVRLWQELGRLFHLRGDYDNALSAYEKVVRLSWVMASRGKAAQALLHTGQIWRQKGDPRLALDYMGQALDLFEQSGDPTGTADTLDDIGQVLWLLGRYDEALDRSAAALERRRSMPDRAKVASSLLSIGNIERHRGLFNEAEACYTEALGIYRAAGDKAGLAACLNAVGMLAYQRGDTPAARRSWEDALELVEQMGSSPLQAVLLCHLGEVHLQQGNLAEAQARFTAALSLAHELSDRRLLSEATRSLGTLALKQGDTKEALARCTEALHLAEEAGVRVDVGRALISLGQVHAATLFDESQQEEPAALEYLRRGVRLFRELGNEAELAAGLMQLGRYHLERGETEEGGAVLGEAEAIFTRLGIRVSDEMRDMLSEL
jgi:tetratricopeptide (TPR) repeat protein